MCNKAPTYNAICSLGLDGGICLGDSGGPLFCDDGNGTLKLYGVVSSGSGLCAKARLPKFLKNKVK